MSARPHGSFSAHESKMAPKGSDVHAVSCSPLPTHPTSSDSAKLRFAQVLCQGLFQLSAAGSVVRPWQEGEEEETRVREERRSKRTGGQGGREEVTEGEEGQEGEEREEGRGGRGSGGRSRLQPVQACASLTRARPPTLSSGTDPPLSLLRPRVSKDRCKSYNCSPRALALGPARALEVSYTLHGCDPLCNARLKVTAHMAKEWLF